MNQEVNKDQEFLVEQKRLKKPGTILLIAILGTTGAFSTDMYLPAAPSLADYFGVSHSAVNLVLTCFFVCYALGLLLWGPISDKYGRKRIILTSIVIYMIASASCSLAPNIAVLICARVFQAIGAGGMYSMSTALVKDCFSGKARKQALAVVQTIMVIGPMGAPVIGGQILRFFEWRATFAALVIFGICCFFLTLLLQETLPKESRRNEPIFKTFKTLTVIGRNKGFILFLLMAALLTLAYMSYISVASYIYVEEFHLTEQGYSYYFAINSAFLALGPMIYLRLSRKIGSWGLAFGGICLAIIGAILVLTIGHHSPLVFLLAFLPLTLGNSYYRAFNTNILLDQYDGDTGSVASMINFLHMLCGSIATFIATLPDCSYITTIGFIILICAICSLCIGIYLRFSKTKLRGM